MQEIVKSRFLPIFAALALAVNPVAATDGDNAIVDFSDDITVTAADGDSACSDRRISANSVRTLDDVQTFVECAKQFLDDNGPQAALQAFNEDGRWKHGPTYIFVLELKPSGKTARTFVFPPDPATQGTIRGASIVDFGTDLYAERYRILRNRDSAWTYYTFAHPVTGARLPKASYLAKVEWMDSPAVLGAGLYAPDLPGSCLDDEVNAAALTANPSEAALQAFVRCAALVVEEEGYAARQKLEEYSRWRDGTSYAFVLDRMGNQVLTGNGLRVNGNSLHEWLAKDPYMDQFGGREIVDVGDTFGESFIYYNYVSPYTGAVLPKAGFFKRAVAQGIPLLVGAGYQPEAGSGAARPGCADNHAAAAAVQTREDLRAFVQCAAEYVKEHGAEEARRAFNEDERWKAGPIYVFVDGIQPSGVDAAVHVYPPEPAREGSTWGAALVDAFGSDYYHELHRILSIVDEGWIHYAFANPETGLEEPKSSYVIEIDWHGERAAIGAGIYRRDLPGTCDPDQVNAIDMHFHPSDAKLQEFVRCAAHLLQSGGQFAIPILTKHSTWNYESIYVFGVDPRTGEVKFSGNPASFDVSGRQPEALWEGRDLNEAALVFGETFWYYNFLNPAKGMEQSKVSFARLVHTSDGPVLVGSGYNP